MILFFVHFFLLAVALAAPYPLRRQISAAGPCPANHVIAARGSLEPQGFGQLQTLADKIVQMNPGTSMEAVVYPATIESYDKSTGNGTAAVGQALAAFVQKCPSSKVAMIGYSQGAQIVGDSMCGGGGAPGLAPLSLPIDPQLSNKVNAVIFYGDPRRVANSSFNQGNATTSGIFARPANISCDVFASKIQSFCNARDPFCALGDDLATHLAYPPQFDEQAAKFVTSKFQSGTPSVAGPAPAVAARGVGFDPAKARAALAPPGRFPPWMNVVARQIETASNGSSRASNISAVARRRANPLPYSKPWVNTGIKVESGGNRTAASNRTTLR